MELRNQTLYVEDYFGNILFHTGNGGKLMHNTVDLDRGNGNSGKDRKQHAPHAVAEGRGIASLQRFHNEPAVSAVACQFSGIYSGLFNFYHLKAPFLRTVILCSAVPGTVNAALFRVYYLE